MYVVLVLAVAWSGTLSLSWYLRCHYRADVLTEFGIPVPYLGGLANFGRIALNIHRYYPWITSLFTP